MMTIGLDIGTTSLCALLLDCETGGVVSVLTRPNTGAAVQDPAAILAACLEMCGALRQKGRIGGLGISGQMHGGLYLDEQGGPLSPLYTWQYGGDARAKTLSRISGYPMARGYGLSTIWQHKEEGALPAGARSFCTIGDYVAMALCGEYAPRMHASLAQSMGMFDMAAGLFDEAALRAAGIPATLLPELVAEGPLGTWDGIPVFCAVGDNQAAVFGTLGGNAGALVNIGTGAQVSVCGQNAPTEARPYLYGQALHVGAALCGGRAFALLRDFFAASAAMMGLQPPADLYERMVEAALKAADEPPLAVDARFCGTREQPGLRGGVRGLGVDNFTPGSLARGLLAGIAEELAPMLPPDFQGELVGGGNALRKNPLLRAILEERLDRPLRLTRCPEEAAFGAALLGALADGVFADMAAAGQLVQYE